MLSATLCHGHCCFIHCMLCAAAYFVPWQCIFGNGHCCFIYCIPLLHDLYVCCLLPHFCAVGAATLCHGHCCFIYCMYAVYCHICCAVGTAILYQKHYCFIYVLYAVYYCMLFAISTVVPSIVGCVCSICTHLIATATVPCMLNIHIIAILTQKQH